MRIDRIDLYHVAMPLIEPWRTAYGEDAVIESVLVRMASGQHVGWGEASPLAAPTYSPEWAGGVFATCRQWLAPRLVGQDVESGTHLQQLLGLVKGNYFAKAGLDLAWWDLHARQQGQPLYRILGGTNSTVTVGADFGVMDSIDSLLEKVGEAVAAGFARIKLKFRPGWDVPMLRAVRQALPRTVIHIDCNSGYRLEDAPLFASLDEFGLAMIEQPLGHDDLLDHAALQKRIGTPVCLDESITSIERARQALAVGACRFVNVKPGRVGGLTNAAAIHDLCRQHGIPCWVGGMLESAVGAAHCIALATLPNFTYPADIAVLSPGPGGAGDRALRPLTGSSSRPDWHRCGAGPRAPGPHDARTGDCPMTRQYVGLEASPLARVVLDTNILVASAYSPDSASRHILCRRTRPTTSWCRRPGGRVRRHHHERSPPACSGPHRLGSRTPTGGISALVAITRGMIPPGVRSELRAAIVLRHTTQYPV